MKRHSVLTALFALCLFLILLLTAVETVCFRMPFWFSHEYEKYDVLERLNRTMTMEDALYVTREMTDYLRGERDDLVVTVRADGTRQEFFTAREKAHLADVRRLFASGFALRRTAFTAAILLLLLRLFLARRAGLSRSARLRRFAGEYLAASSCWLLAAVLFAFVVSLNFDRWFVLFHELFFDNDLWLLYPSRDDLINLLPEGFFLDTAVLILSLFLAAALLLDLAVILLRRFTRPASSPGNHRQRRYSHCRGRARR